MFESILYIYLLVSLFYQFFGDVPITFLGGAVWTLDILNLILINIILFNLLKNTVILKFGKSVKFANNFNSNIISKILIILFIPVFIGLGYNHDIQTILRDFRAFIAFLVPFAFPVLLKTEKKLYKFIKFLMFSIIFCLFFYYVSFLFDLKITSSRWGTERDYITQYGVISHKYGVVSALYYYPILAFFFLNVWFSSRNENNKNKYLIYSIISFFPIFYFSMRSLSYGVIISIIINFMYIKNYKKYIIILSTFLLIIPIIVLSIPTKYLINIPQVERHLSLLIPEVSTKGVYANREVRIRAIYLANEIMKNPIIGSGYGDSKDDNIYGVENKMRYWNHSSFAWSIYKLGYVGTILFFILFIYLIKNGFKNLKSLKNKKLKSFLLSIYLVLIAYIFLGAGSNVFFKGFMGSSLLSILLGLILSIESIRIKNKNYYSYISNNCN